jgi:hypothetical protein
MLIKKGQIVSSAKRVVRALLLPALTIGALSGLGVGIGSDPIKGLVIGLAVSALSLALIGLLFRLRIGLDYGKRSGSVISFLAGVIFALCYGLLFGVIVAIAFRLVFSWRDIGEKIIDVWDWARRMAVEIKENIF